MKLLRVLAGAAAGTALLIAGPLAASTVATNAAAPPVIRAAASAVAAPEADAAYPYQCRWQWKRLPSPWWIHNYAWVRVCYQVPN